MAEQYASFQGREPNIDVNLFVDAVSKGINQGNASPGVAASIFKGISQGIESYVDISAKMANTEAQQIQNDVNSAPEVIQARKDSIVGQSQVDQLAGYNARLDQQVQESDEIIALRNHASSQEAKQVENQQKINDFNAQQNLTAAIASKDPAVMNAALQDGNSLSVMFRDPKVGNSIVTAMKGAGADPYLVDNVSKALNEVEKQKQLDNLVRDSLRHTQAEALKKQDKISEATATLNINPQISSVMVKGADGAPFDPNRFDIVPAGFTQMKNGQIQYDDRGRPLVSNDASLNSDDKRYFATYNGKVIDTLYPEDGKKLREALETYRLGAAATAPAIINGAGLLPTSPTVNGSVNTTSSGLAGLDQSQIALTNASVDRQLSAASPGATPSQPTSNGLRTPSTVTGTDTPTTSIENVLKNKTPDQQSVITSVYKEQRARLNNAPREVRDIVSRVNSSPTLRNQTPIVKALASQESRGINEATSPTGTKGILQVTGATYADVQRRHPRELPADGNNNEESEVLAGKIYLGEQLSRFGDLRLALAAYNAGPGALSSAIADTRGAKTWENVKPNLKKYVSEKKFVEVENYPESVLKFFRYYNG